MAISVTARPAPMGSQVSAERANSASVQGAVATELDYAQTVNAATSGGAVHQDPLRATAAQPGTPDLVLDAQSREVIFRAIEWSRRVSRQVPEVAARRLKAYSRPTDDGAGQTGRQTDTEL